MKKKYIIISEVEKKKNFNNSFSPFISVFSNRYLLKKYNFKADYINNYSSNKNLILKDAKYIVSFYEKILRAMTLSLNRHHNVNYSITFWRILLGPWLGMFIYSYFLKWKSIKNLKKINSNYKIKLFPFDQNDFVPKNMEEFSSFIKSEYWHQKIGQKVCLNFFKKKNQYVERYLKKKILKKNSKKNLLKKLISLILYKFPSRKNNKYLIINSYLGFFRESLLNLKLQQLPTFDLLGNTLKYEKLDIASRFKIKKSFSNIKFKKKFEHNFINDFINEIPTAFIEGFQNLRTIYNKLNYPNKPKVIFSSNFHRNTLLSYYIAKKKENGSKLFIGQHGGLYGAAIFSWFEKHELKIANRFFSWGWKNNKKIKKLGIIVKTDKVKWSKNNKDILLFMRSRNKYPASFLSGTNTENYYSYCQNINNFINGIKINVKNNLVLRYPPNYNYLQDNNFLTNTRNLKFNNKKELFKTLKKSLLVINSTHSTSFLQVMSINFPNILIMNGKDNPLKDQKNFDTLRKAGIFHNNYKSAVKFVNKLDNSNKIFNWWYSEKTQKAVKIFCKNHSQNNNKIISDIKEEMVNEKKYN